MSKKLMLLISIVLVLALAGNAFGVIVWDNESDNNEWKTALNWDPNIVPTDANTVEIMLTGLSGCIIDANHTGLNAATAYNLKVGSTGGPGDLLMTGGFLDIVGGVFAVGDNDVGTFTMSGGSLTVDVNDLIIADEPNSGGSTMTLSAGTVTLADMYVGDDAAGTLTISGGTITVTDDLYIADDETTSDGSTMTMTGGTVTVDSEFFVGDDGVGTFNISGGSLTTAPNNDVRIADESTSGGSTMNISGSGSVTILKKLHVGRDAPGHIVISSGSLWAADEISIGDRTGSTGSTITMTGGTVFTNNNLFVGEQDIGHLVISGGTLTAMDDLEIAEETGSGGSTMTISGTAVVIIDEPVEVGNSARGELHISGGSLTTVGGEDLIIADGGGTADSKMTMSGGDVNVSDDMLVGDDDVGYFEMSGGTLYVSDDLIVSDEAASAGSWMWVKGGTVTVNNDFEIQNNGYVYLDGGTIVVVNDDDFVIESTSSMDIMGGTLILSGNEVSAIEVHVSEGRLTGYGVARAVMVEYNSGTDKTTVWADASRLAFAYNPNPADEELDVPKSANLTWSPGKDISEGSDYNKHILYLSMVEADVNDGSAPSFVVNGANMYDPPSDFNYEERWYWRIDEVNVSDVVETTGDVWTFEVAFENIDDPNLIGWWKLDGDFNDSSGYKNHGIPVGDAGFASGVINQALDLDGDGDAVLIPFAQRLIPKVDGINSENNEYSDFSISLWFYREGGWAAGNQALFSHRGDGGAGWILRRDNGNEDIEFRTLGPGGDDMQTDFEPVSGEWVHVVATYAPNAVTVADGVKRIYIDGEFDNDDVDVYEHPDLSIFDLYIGAQVDSNNITAGNFWRGMIDDVRLYTKALSPAEVWDLYREKDRALAYKPNPRNRETGVVKDPTLSWSPGDYVSEAGPHMVNFGDDPENPGNIDIVVRDTNDYSPGLLELGKTYYWRVDEFNDTAPNDYDIGDEWHFTVINHLVVDDMESYGDSNTPGPGGAIFFVWRDGWTLLEIDGFPPGFLTNGTGASIGHWNYPYAETTIVNGGAQSMPYYYDNDGTVHGGNNPANPENPDNPQEHYSKAEAEISDLPSGIVPNWLTVGAKVLSLQFHGDVDNDVEPMWVELTDTAGGKAKVKYGPPYLGEDVNDINEASWHEWNIDLQDFADGGVDLTDVNSIAIIIGTVGGADGTGTVYIDDIRLYAARCVPNKRDPDFAKVDYVGDECVVNAEELDVMFGDWLETDDEISPPAVGPVAHYEFEGDFTDSSGNAIHGTPSGAYTDYDTDRGSNVVRIDSKGNYVDLGNPTDPCLLDFGTGDWTLCAWVNTTMSGGSSDADKGVIYGKGGDSGGGHRCALYVNEDTDDGHLNLITDDDVTKYTPDSDIIISDGEWHHVVGQRDGTTLRLYVDGVADGDTETISPSYNLSGTHQYNAYIGAITDYDDTNPTLYKFFVGSIDDVRVYDYALSLDEILYVIGGSYVELTSPANVYPKVGDEGVYNPANLDIVNFKDYAVLAERWLDKDYFPPE